MSSFTQSPFRQTRTAPLLILLSLTLTACVTSQPALDDHSPTFSEAVTFNTAAQHVVPTPAQKNNTFIPADRDRKALAIKQYKSDTTEELKPIRTVK